MTSPPALLVDLDDTLYDEREYVHSGFRHIAAQLSAECQVSAEDLFVFLCARLAADGRGRLFDDLLIAHGLRATPDRVAALVNAYRDHRPAIGLVPEVTRTLQQLRGRFAIAIVTDGLASMQQRKTQALGLASLVDTIVYCAELGEPKPSPKAFQVALDRLGNPPLAAVVGDDVGRDLPAAVTLEAPFVRVRRGRFAALATPAVAIPIVEVNNFADVPAALASVVGARTGLV